jgi:hypothetical protein
MVRNVKLVVNPLLHLTHRPSKPFTHPLSRCIMDMTPFHQRSGFLSAHDPYDQIYGTYLGRTMSSRRPISHTSIGSNPSQSFSFRLPQTPQPYVYSEHAAPVQEPAGEQSQAGAHDSESGEETQDSSAAQTGSCCANGVSCCMPALAAKAFSLALGVDKKFDLHIKCACDNHMQFSNKDR